MSSKCIFLASSSMLLLLWLSVEANIVEEYSHILAENDRLLLQDDDNGDDEEEEENGAIYTRCNRRRTCQEGLDCILSMRGRFCFPLTCVRDAVEETYLEQGLESYVDRLLEKVGMRGAPDGPGASFFNQSTLQQAKGQEDALLTNPELSRYIVNEGISTKIHTAMQEDPTALNAFQAKAQRCFPQRRAGDNPQEQDDDDQQTETFYMGLHMEASALFKFVYQLGTGAYTNGTIPDDACFETLCGGIGLDVDFHGAPVLGVLSSEVPSDIRRPSLMMDADASLLLHLLGGAVGFTLTDNLFKAEWATFFSNIDIGIGWGTGAGVGVYGCLPAFNGPSNPDNCGPYD